MLELDIAALDRLPEVEPVGEAHAELGGGHGGIGCNIVTCVLTQCNITVCVGTAL